MAETLDLCMAQMTSTDSHSGNVDTVRTIATAAAERGAALICLPEAANMMQRDRNRAAEIIQPESSDPFLAACRDLARKHGFWIHAGSLALREDGAERFANRSFVIDAAGRRSSPATTRSTCSTSTCPTVSGGANPSATRRAARRSWSIPPGDRGD